MALLFLRETASREKPTVFTHMLETIHKKTKKGRDSTFTLQ